MPSTHTVSLLLSIATPALHATLPPVWQETTIARPSTDTPASEITLERIMGDPEWIARSPERAYWSADSRRVYFERERAGDNESSRQLFELDLASGRSRAVPDAELSVVDARGGVLDADRSTKLFARHGDLFLLDLTTFEERPLTRTTASERPLGFVGANPLFERDGSWLVRDLTSGFERELADLRWADAPDDDEGEEGDYLERQQERLLDVVADRKAARDRARERSRTERELDPTRLQPIYMGDGWRESQSAVAPSGTHALLAVTRGNSRGGERDSMPVWITDSSWVEPRDVRAHVGFQDHDDTELRLVDLENRVVHTIALDDLPARGDDPLAFLDEPSEDGEAPEVDRGVSISRLSWSRDGAHAAAQVRSHDNKDRWIVVVDLEGAVRVVEHRRDEAWIGWSFNEQGWLDDGRLWFLSEASGWSQLYLWDPSDESLTRATEGDHEVSDVQLASDGRTLYFSANAAHPGQTEVWRLDTNGGTPEQLTRLGGLTTFDLSPDGRSLLLQSSFPLQPPELYVQAAEPSANPRQLTDTVEPAWSAMPWIPPRIVGVPSDHGRPIWTRVYLPPDEVALPEGERPLVMFVHGAGYLQNAHFGWSRYFREFMFHSLLAHRGYVVLDMDYRASSGYGRDWRTAIYRQMGTPELADYLDGLEYAVAKYGVDPAKVGIYGGSYGGFMALMALFKEPGTFAAGAALRPVTDWAHYNHGYTSNILNTPERDPEAFERSSPIEFAQNLEDALLICHGLVDDNVLAKDSIRLAQRLIELGKDDWELALYPNEPHGFVVPSSWRDEYARILELFEEHVRGVDR